MKPSVSEKMFNFAQTSESHEATKVTGLEKAREEPQFEFYEGEGEI